MFRSKVPYPAIPATKHHVVDMPPVQFSGRVDNGKLLDWLNGRLAETSTFTTEGLVTAAVYRGLADRINRGDFE